jgi:hypothetical protein
MRGHDAEIFGVYYTISTVNHIVGLAEKSYVTIIQNGYLNPFFKKI